jgi:hypothetical protein
VIIAVAADVATELPALFPAMTVTRMLAPTSPVPGTNVGAEAPASAEQPPPFLLQRDHW